jgi:molybdopterin converting factor small subunit
MATLRIPPSLSRFAGGSVELEGSGRTVRELLAEVLASYPELGRHLLREDGGLRPYVNLFVRDENIRGLRGLDTELAPGDVATAVPSIAGGSSSGPGG